MYLTALPRPSLTLPCCLLSCNQQHICCEQSWHFCKQPNPSSSAWHVMTSFLISLKHLFIRSLRSFFLKEDLDSLVIGYCSSSIFSSFIFFQEPCRDGNIFSVFCFFPFEYTRNGRILNCSVRICGFSFLLNAQAADWFVCAGLLISEHACCLEQKPAHLQLFTE